MLKKIKINGIYFNKNAMNINISVIAIIKFSRIIGKKFVNGIIKTKNNK